MYSVPNQQLLKRHKRRLDEGKQNIFCLNFFSNRTLRIIFTRITVWWIMRNTYIFRKVDD